MQQNSPAAAAATGSFFLGVSAIAAIGKYLRAGEDQFTQGTNLDRATPGAAPAAPAEVLPHATLATTAAATAAALQQVTQRVAIGVAAVPIRWAGAAIAAVATESGA